MSYLFFIVCIWKFFDGIYIIIILLYPWIKKLICIVLLNNDRQNIIKNLINKKESFLWVIKKYTKFQFYWKNDEVWYLFWEDAIFLVKLLTVLVETTK